MPKLLSLRQAMIALGASSTNNNLILRACILNKVKYVVTEDERILIDSESLTEFIASRKSQ